MKRLPVILIGLGVLACVIGWGAWRVLTYDYRMQRLGYELMDSIDAFQATHHRLPTYDELAGNDDELTIEFKGENFYYEIMDDGNYWVGYLHDAETTCVCTSATREWQ